MSFKDYQREADEWTGQYTPQYFPPLGIVAQMSEELGEVARIVLAREGVKPLKEGEKGELGQELAELVFAVTCMANSQGIDIDENWERMMRERHYGRDRDRFEEKR